MAPQETPQVDPSELPSDGEDVIAGVDPPTPEELAAHRAHDCNEECVNGNG